LGANSQKTQKADERLKLGDLSALATSCSELGQTQAIKGNCWGYLFCRTDFETGKKKYDVALCDNNEMYDDILHDCVAQNKLSLGSVCNKNKAKSTGE